MDTSRMTSNMEASVITTCLFPFFLFTTVSPNKVGYSDKHDTLSDIHFINDVNTTELSRELHRKSNMSKYGVDGDPDFIVRVRGVDYPLCFHVGGQQGEVLRLVQYEPMELYVNAKIIERNETRKRYLGSVSILRHNVKIFANRKGININRYPFSWTTMAAFRLYGHRVIIGQNLLAITFRNKNVTLVVRRHVLVPENVGGEDSERSRRMLIYGAHNREEENTNRVQSEGEADENDWTVHEPRVHHENDDSLYESAPSNGARDREPMETPNSDREEEEFIYLGFYISDSRGLNQQCRGLLGQFVHKNGSLDGVRIRNGKRKARLRIFAPGYHHARQTIASMSDRDNLGIERRTPCWLLRRGGEDIIDGNYIDYIVRDLRDKEVINFNK